MKKERIMTIHMPKDRPLVLGLVVLIILYRSADVPVWQLWLNIAFLLVCTCIIMVDHVLYADGLVVRVLFLPIRKIGWNKISGAVFVPPQRFLFYIPKGRDATEMYKNVLILLKPYEISTLQKWGWHLFSYIHPWKLIRIPLIEKEEFESIYYLERYLGSIAEFEQAKD